MTDRLYNKLTDTDSNVMKPAMYYFIPGGPGSIPGTTRGKKYWVWNGVHSAS
jgi:hypothetical protein